MTDRQALSRLARMRQAMHGPETNRPATNRRETNRLTINGQALNRRSLLASMAATIPALSMFGSAAAEVNRAQLSEQDRDDLERISSYINDIETLKGRFVQVASNGVRDEGSFYFRRPGRLRFEYDEPNPMLIVSDGTWIAVSDRKLNSVNRFPFANHPLKTILKKDVDLAAEQSVVSVLRVPGSLVVLARDSDGILQGELEIVFADPAIELLQWKMVDPQGFAVTIALRDVERDAKLSSKLFKIEEAENPFRQQF